LAAEKRAKIMRKYLNGEPFLKSYDIEAVKLRLRNLVPGTELVTDRMRDKMSPDKAIIERQWRTISTWSNALQAQKDAKTGVSATGESARGQSDDKLPT
jgi:hypothetical protein